MTCKTGSVALLLGALGVAAGAAANENPSGLAENRGLSPMRIVVCPLLFHNTHDLGMAFDLGVSNYIKGAQTDIKDTGNTPQMVAALAAAMQANADGWSVADAVSYSAMLVNETDPKKLNKQMLALRDFLSLYALTQADGQAGLAGKVVNTTASNLFGGMISGVHIGGQTYTDSQGGVHKQNPYPNIKSILDKLGIYDVPIPDHQNHFHIYLQPPKRLEIGSAHLLADAAQASPAADAATSSATPLTAAQGLLDYALTLTEGEELMFTMDVPYIPAQQTPIVLAQATTPAAGATPQPDYILKDCTETEHTIDPMSALRGVDPGYMLHNYLVQPDTPDIDLASIKITLLEGTKHGNLVAGTSTSGRTAYGYDPEPDYLGNDRAVFMAEFEGKIYKIVVDIKVLYIVDDNSNQCPPPQLIKVKKPSTGSSGYDSGFGAGYDLSSVTVNFAELAGGAVGQAVGNTITLDDNAAGHNWFIDTTPADNSEYLPTSNPDEWVAKVGSAAYGKMDMLTVLLHEYGHALGIDHSAATHDYMSTTLTPGVRRLPSAAELALMQQLVAQAKDGLTTPSDPFALSLSKGASWFDGLTTNGSDNAPSPIPFPLPLGGLGFAFAGLLRPNRYGSSSIDVVSTRYEAVANASFTNLDTTNAWYSQGSVDITPSAIDPSTSSGRTVASATLNEISSAQTRLSQVFMLNDKDRYLSFTLSGTALDNPSGLPQDAFEVALLDANTGLSVLGTDGLTRTDAFLNLQADGAQHASDCVTCTFNSDGSRTYRVDLSNVAKNTAVNLSFDLLGFGANNSYITLRDVRVSGLPQLHDDTAAMLEDGTLVFDQYAQADAALRPMLASRVVNAPTHGAITVNADGTFSYKPDANYNGTDSFSYRLSDGPLDSNLATVTLSIASVNDAPTGTDATVTTLEDNAYIFKLADFGFSDALDVGPQASRLPAGGTPALQGNNFAAVTMLEDTALGIAL